MKLIRFMSAAEAIKLLDSQDVLNETSHRNAGQNSDGIGFCFAIAGNGTDSYVIHKAAARLSGVAIMHVCLVAATKELPPGFVFTRGYYKEGYLKEVSATKYSLADFKIWGFYAPHDLSGLAPPFSGNWVHPELVAKGTGY